MSCRFCHGTVGEWVTVPQASHIKLQDPKLLAWLHKPQLVQRDEKEIEGYTLQVTLPQSMPDE